MTVLKNLYDLLGFTEEKASDADILAAFKGIAKDHHPDKFQGDGTPESKEQNRLYYEQVTAAKETLLNPDKKAKYMADHSLTEQLLEMQALMAPQDLKRPSDGYHELLKIYQDAYVDHPVARVSESKRTELLDKSSVFKSSHFSQQYYQHAYTLKKTDAKGAEFEAPFSSVFKWAREQGALFPIAQFQPDLTKPLTVDIALTLFLNFLKKDLYGHALKDVITYLQQHVETLSTPADLKLCGAILDLLKMTQNTQEDSLQTQQILDQIHVLYDAAFDHYTMIQASLDRNETLKKEAIENQKQAETIRASLAQKQIEAKKVLEQIDHSIPLTTLMLQMIQVKVLDADHKMTSALNEVDHEYWRGEIQFFDDEKQMWMESLAEQQVIKKTVEDQLSTLEPVLNQLAEELSKITNQIKSYENYASDLEQKKFNNRLLTIMDNKYFKLLLANTLSDYWKSQNNKQATLENLKKICKTLPTAQTLKDKKYSLIAKIILKTDQRLMAHSELTTPVAKHYEDAEVFIDLANTVKDLSVILNAYMAAGLSYQIAATKEPIDAHKMAAETLALMVYQKALMFTSKTPTPYTLYATNHLVKWISELSFAVNTMNIHDLRKLVGECAKPQEKISATRYASVEVYNGSVLESLEGAIDRSLYTLNVCSIYMHYTPQLDQLDYKHFQKALIAALLDQLFQKMQTPEQRQIFEENHELPDILYEFYQQQLQLPRDQNDVQAAEKLSLLYLQSMIALLGKNESSLPEVAQWMDSPYNPIPQTIDGWMTSGPLNFPRQLKDWKSLGMEPCKSFNGYSFNEKTGKIDFFLTPWTPADSPESLLFTTQDVADLIEKGVGTASFSLEQDDPYKTYSPLQMVKDSPAGLKGTAYEEALFLADYLMKAIGQGTEKNCQPPYNTRPMKTLLQGLDPLVQEKLLAYSRRIMTDAKASRFWIEMGQIPMMQTSKRGITYVAYEAPEITIKTHLLTIDPSGRLVDAPPEDRTDTSVEAEFARTFTEFYDLLAKELPIFNQLKEFYKISGAIRALQTKRLENKLTRGALQEQLDNVAHWIAEANKLRAEWTSVVENQPYWDRLLQQEKDKFKARLEDDSYWASQIEEALETLETTQQALKDPNSTAYHQEKEGVRQININYFSKIYADAPLSIDSEAFKKFYEVHKKKTLALLHAQNLSAAELSQVAASLILSPEKFLSTNQANLQEQFMQALVSYQPPFGVSAYQEAIAQFKTNNVVPIAEMQAMYLVNQVLADPVHPKSMAVWASLTSEISAQMTEEVRRTRSEILTSTISLGDQAVPSFVCDKPMYIIGDETFEQFYQAVRAIQKASLIRGNPGVPEAALEAHLEQNFSKQSQLTEFNAIVSQKRNSVRDQLMLLHKSASSEKTEAAIQAEAEMLTNAFLTGLLEPLINKKITATMTEAQQNIKDQSAKKMPIVQKAFDTLLKDETVKQIQEMQALDKTICPDYSHLIPLFAVPGYQKAVEAFVQGDLQPLVESETTSDLDKKLKTLDTDLRAQAEITVNAQKTMLKEQGETVATTIVNQRRAKMRANMEGLIQDDIKQTKRSYEHTIKSLNKQYSGFVKFGLGEMDDPDAPFDTHGRVPSILTYQESHRIYGGVSAMPSWLQVDSLSNRGHRAASSLSSYLSEFSGLGGVSKSLLTNALSFGLSLFSAESALADIQYRGNLMNYEVSRARSNLQNTIDRAKMAEKEAKQQQQADQSRLWDLGFKSSSSFDAYRVSLNTLRQASIADQSASSLLYHRTWKPEIDRVKPVFESSPFAPSPFTPYKDSLNVFKNVQIARNEKPQNLQAWRHQADYTKVQIYQSQQQIDTQKNIIFGSTAAKAALEYAFSAIKGTLLGCGDVAHTLWTPYVSIIKPTKQFFGDAIKIVGYRWATSPDQEFLPSSAAAQERQEAILRTIPSHQKALHRMLDRVNTVKQAWGAVSEETGPKRTEMAARVLTSFLVTKKLPGAVLEGASALGITEQFKRAVSAMKQQFKLKIPSMGIEEIAGLEAAFVGIEAELAAGVELAETAAGLAEESASILHHFEAVIAPLEATDTVEGVIAATGIHDEPEKKQKKKPE